MGAELEYTPPPAYTSLASVVAEPAAGPPMGTPAAGLTRPRVQPVQLPCQLYQRPSTPNPGGFVQLTVFIAMPTPSRPLYVSCPRPYSRHLASTSTSPSPSPSRTYHNHPSPSALTSPHTHQISFPGINFQQELTLGVTITPFIPDPLPSPSSSAAKA